MAGDNPGAETQEELQAQEDLGREQTVQGKPQVRGKDWEKAAADRLKRYMPFEG